MIAQYLTDRGNGPDQSYFGAEVRLFLRTCDGSQEQCFCLPCILFIRLFVLVWIGHLLKPPEMGRPNCSAVERIYSHWLTLIQS
jgi:hypothetical protein